MSYSSHKIVAVWLMLGLAVFALPATLSTAADQIDYGQTYVAQADDRLDWLADKFYQDVSRTQLIVDGTNLQSRYDDRYVTLAEPQASIGQRLFIPQSAETLLAYQEALRPPPTEAQTQLLARLEPRGIPPELNNETWLNSDPLKLADLHGQVVIVEFWTYG